jgi:hypothetical protein
MQRQHEQVAMHMPEQRAAFNHGAPTMAAMARPASPHGESAMHGPEANGGGGHEMARPPEHEMAQREGPGGQQHGGQPHGEPRGEPHGGHEGGREH